MWYCSQRLLLTIHISQINVNMAQIGLSLIEYMRYIGGNVNSRCVVEGEEVLNAGHIILYGKTECQPSFIKVSAICLQTSALYGNPHEISGELKITSQSVGITKMFCTCKAGAGGHCKHISAFLILLTRKNLGDLEEVSKTELACSWGNMKGSVKEEYKPVPVRQMPCIKKKYLINVMENEVSANSNAVLEYFVRNLPESAIAKHRKGRTIRTSFLENLTADSKNFTVVLDNAAQSVAMMQVYGYECSFHSLCCEQTYQNILNEEPDEIIKIGQNSPEWHNARKFRITGSRCYEIFTYGGNDWTTKSSKYFWPKSFSNKFTRHGLKYENAARESFITKTASNVFECGMVFSEKNKWLGYSPDGLLFENGVPVGLLEIKCLYAGAKAPITEAIAACPYIIEENNRYVLRKRHKYYGQIQMGMSVLNVNKCYLVLYSSFDNSSIIVEVSYDHEFSVKMLKTIKMNYFSHMIHVICESNK